MSSTVTEFLKSKWRNAFRVFDVNKDGKLTVEDYILIADYFSNKAGATEEQAEQTREEWVKYFRFLQPDPSIEVDVTRFVETHTEMFKDVHFFKDLVHCTSNVMFDRMDLNGDGFISSEEFAIYYEAIGIFQKELITEHFGKIDRNGDGLIQREEFVDEVVRYFSDPNPETGVSYYLPMSQD